MVIIIVISVKYIYILYLLLLYHCQLKTEHFFCSLSVHLHDNVLGPESNLWKGVSKVQVLGNNTVIITVKSMKMPICETGT